MCLNSMTNFSNQLISNALKDTADVKIHLSEEKANEI